MLKSQSKFYALSALLGVVLGGAIIWFYAAPKLSERTVLLAAQQAQLTKQQEQTQALAACHIDNQVMRNTQRALQELLEEQQEQLSEQAKDLKFYRQIMLAEPSKEGLDLNGASIIAQGDQRYLFRFTFVQYARKHKQLNLNYEIQLQGLQEEIQSVYPLDQLAVEQTQLPERLKFKYFQTVEGVLQLPTGFEVQTIHIRLYSTNKSINPKEFTIQWQVQES